MLRIFKEFQMETLELPHELQKEVFGWYLEGAKNAAEYIMQKYNHYRESLTDYDDCVDFAFDDFNSAIALIEDCIEDVNEENEEEKDDE